MSGVGRVYLRGRWYSIAYYIRGEKGKPHRESAHTTSKAVAEKLLRERMREAEPVSTGRLTFEDLQAGIVRDYEINARRSTRRLSASLKRLRSFFGGRKVDAITVTLIRDYVFGRHEAQAKNATINRELACLKRMFAIAKSEGTLLRAPAIKLLREGNPRQGFFEHEQYLAVQRHLPADLKDPVTFLYLSGWRLEEMQTLQWRDVDLNRKAIRLRSEHSKSGEPRTLMLSGELLEILVRQRARFRMDCPYVFHRGGRQLRDFRQAWKVACRAAGVPGRLRHDMRRTAVRNLIRAGVPDTVAMRITGHRTRAVFDRYAIVSESDLERAQEQLSEYLSGESKGRRRKIV